MSGELPRPFGNYTLLKLLARGGMGEIYLARTAGITGFEKYYAVKKLLKKFTHDNDVGARFIDEAKLGARLQHPNIVQVYDLGRVTDELYMATEFVDGFDLRRVLRFCHEKKKRIPLDIALFIVREILSGLAYAHRQVDAEGHSINLIHRDISPQNVLVSFEGEVKIIDFGLAKSTQRSQETQANVLLGNFGYMSPEQARGHQLDVRTDVYSAGIVLFELVTGTKRFVEENPLRLLEMVARPTPIVPSDRVPGTPKTIDRIYSKATAPAKEERFESAESFRDDITTALHKINPKASRENLAQFLNHLFLGGAAPAPVDSDSLDDKSVAIRARDLHEASDAFQKAAGDDVKDRSLSEFSDEAPQTASHTMMRQARAGDVLTHQQLTDDDMASPSSPTMAMPAISAKQIADAQAAAAGLPPPSEARALASPAVQIDVEVDDPSEVEVAVPARAGSGPLGGDLGVGTPTSVYDSPQWPGELDRAAADAEPILEISEVIDVDPTGDDAPLDMQADIQAELQAQLDAQLQQQIEEQAAQAEVQRQLEAHAAEKAAAAAAEHATAAEKAATDKRAAADAKAAAAVAAEKAAADKASADAAAAKERKPPSSPPTRAPPPEQSGVHRAPNIPTGVRGPSQTVGQTTIVTTVGPPPKRPQASHETAQPSIVISMDLEPGEATVVGASAPDPRGTGVRGSDVARTIEVSPVSTDKARSGGFNEGGAHESLIIDFDAEGAESQPPQPAPKGQQQAEDPDKAIRPAAQPLGKRVVPAVAQPKTRTSPGRTAAIPDESAAGSTMPPPTRRRS